MTTRAWTREWADPPDPGTGKDPGAAEPEQPDDYRAWTAGWANPPDPAEIDQDPADTTGTADPSGNRSEPAGNGPDPAGTGGSTDPTGWAGEAGEVGADPRSPTQRRADAFTDLITRALAAGLPDNGGHRPALYLTIDLNQLRDNHPGHTLDGTPLAPSALRQAACDAGIIPAILGSTSQPLDIGRDTRTIPTGLRRALTLRDRGCAFPNCDRPPTWTDAHHITHWANGGPTALNNLVLLCPHHHRLTHHQPWTITINPDTGHPHWQPPPTIAPPGTQLTNHTHHRWTPPSPP